MRAHQILLIAGIALVSCKGPGTEPPTPPETDSEADADTDADSDSDSDADIDCDPVHVHSIDLADAQGDFDAPCGCNFRPGTPGSTGQLEDKYYYELAGHIPEIRFLEGQLRCQDSSLGAQEPLYFNQQFGLAGLLSLTGLPAPNQHSTILGADVASAIMDAVPRWVSTPPMDYRLVPTPTGDSTLTGDTTDARSSIGVIPFRVVNPGDVHGAAFTATNDDDLPVDLNDLTRDIFIVRAMSLPPMLPGSGPLIVHPDQIDTSTNTLLNAVTLDESALQHGPTVPPSFILNTLTVALGDLNDPNDDIVLPASYHNTSLQGILTHELGHGFGLSDLEFDNLGRVMRGATFPGQKRTPVSNAECSTAAFVNSGVNNATLPTCTGDDAGNQLP